MVTVTQTTFLPYGRPLTRDDLDRMPDDGHRYELIDGVLIVSPAPAHPHQRAIGELHVVLHQACTSKLEVLLAPFDVVLAEDTVMQPDILVARRGDLTYRDLPTAPVLAVEVLSPSTRRLDQTLKKARLEVAGCESFWVVDPLEPSLTAWHLEHGRYVEVAHVEADQTWAVDRPFPVQVSPLGLVTLR